MRQTKHRGWRKTACVSRPLRMAMLTAMLALMITNASLAQSSGVIVNLAPLDGLAITPDNLFSYTLQSGASTAMEAEVKGSIRYKEGGHFLSYNFRITLRPGLNRLEAGAVRPNWSFSSSAFRELFMDYHVLPQGTYEYCVSVAQVGMSGELLPGDDGKECLYQKADDLFLITLVDPENNAKLYEHYPVFSWVVNYPFASQLTYRIRVAEIKEGQNTLNAVVRNNPVYTESNLPQTTTTYPLYGTPLETFQPYGWTVDAYYKGILLGGAEPWKFTIVEDSELVGIPREVSYLDIRQEMGDSKCFAIGKLKIKYVLDDLKSDTLLLRLMHDGKEIKIDKAALTAKQGDNRYELDFYQKLKHLSSYTLQIGSGTGERFSVQFIYVNPDFFTR